jgi:hypothetical protein
MGCCGGGRKFIKRIAEQISDVTLTVANVMAAAARDGKVTAERSVVEKRLSVCRQCPHLKGTRCDVCGCFMNIKAGLNGSKCPLKKW